MSFTTRVQFVDDSDGSPLNGDALCQQGTATLPITATEVQFGLNDDQENEATITHSVTI